MDGWMDGWMDGSHEKRPWCLLLYVMETLPLMIDC
jgi:hypothetical protein